MLKLEPEGTPLATAEPGTNAELGTVREVIRSRPAKFFAALGEKLFLIGTDVQLFGDPHARADLLAVDPQGVAVVVIVEREGEHSLLERGLMCAGLVAGWKPDFFFRYPPAGGGSKLRGFLRVPAEKLNHKQRVVLVARSHEVAVWSAARWLSQRHGIEICCVRGRIEPSSGRLLLTREGPQTAAPVAVAAGTVQLISPQPSEAALERLVWSELERPREPALPPLTASAGEACRLLILWRPDSSRAASRTIERRASEIFREKPVQQPASAQLAAAAAIEQPSPSRGSRRAFRVAAIVLLTAALLAAAVLIAKLRKPAQTVQARPPQATVAPLFISGAVHDAASGRAIPGAKLYYGGKTSLTDHAGGFRLKRLDGKELLLVKAPGYRQTQSSIEDGGAIRLDPIAVRGFYVSYSRVGDALGRANILRLLRGTGSNAVVLGIKDVTGYLNVSVDHPLARQIHSADRASNPDLERQVAAWKDDGIYTIALLALFKDDLLARAKPELALRSLNSHRVIRDPDGISWTNPALPPVRDYNLEVAKAAAAAGFDEIQFDFVRYPAEDLSYEGGGRAEYERRLATIVDFLHRANEALAPYNVYVSASVFGSVCTIPNAGVIGQKIEEFAEQVDYLSPMLYPSYFEPGLRHPIPLRHSYQLVYENLLRAAGRLKGEIGRLRPWLQNFPDHSAPAVPLTAETIRNQVKAAEDARANGWMLWDARNQYLNTSEALRLLKREPGGGKEPSGPVSGGSLLPAGGVSSGGGPPTAVSAGDQLHLVAVLLLAGCCLVVLYGAVRMAWLLHRWSHGRPQRRPALAAPGGSATLTPTAVLGAFPQVRPRWQ